MDGQARSWSIEASQSAGVAPAFAGRHHCSHDEGDRLAVAFGARLPGRRRAQETRPEAGIEKGGDERTYRIVAKSKAPKRKSRSGRTAA